MKKGDKFIFGIHSDLVILSHFWGQKMDVFSPQIELGRSSLWVTA